MAQARLARAPRRQRDGGDHDAADAEPGLFEGSFAEAVAHGLGLRPKRIASKWLYDEEGARLFEAVTVSPDYYPARAEAQILRRCGPEIAEALGSGASLVEFGSGEATKARILLDVLVAPCCYVPIDIAAAQLATAAAAIARDYPGLRVIPVAADYMAHFDLPPEARRGRPVGFFPGSTLCNLLPENSRALLRRIRRVLGRGSAFIVGVDLPKDEDVLRRAYNDPGGPIWRFNLNIVARMNRELGTDLDPADFHHEAAYNPAAGRIEAAIYSASAQHVVVDGRRFVLEAGEPLFLEYSHKHAVHDFQQLAGNAGWYPAKAWTDPDGLFSVHLLTGDAR